MYVHGRGGYGEDLSRRGSSARATSSSPAGPGIEYFTKLRHFSIGAAADVVYATKAGAVGFAVYPTVRYTF